MGKRITGGEISCIIHFSGMSYLDEHKTEPEISMPWEMEDKNIQENVESQK